MLRAREPKLLTRDRAERMLDAGSFDECAKLLTDCGYADMSAMSAKEIERYLSSRRDEVFAELEKLAPDKGVVDVFRMKYDYHNAKVLVKAEAVGQDGARLMSRSGRFSPEKLTELYTEESLGRLPAGFAAAVADAKSVLARTANPQLADFILDRAYFAEIRAAAQSARSLPATPKYSPTAQTSRAPCARCAWARILNLWTARSSPAAASAPTGWSPRAIRRA